VYFNIFIPREGRKTTHAKKRKAYGRKWNIK